MAQSPDWPNQALLERRRQEAIAAEPDQASVLAQCGRNQLTLPQAMLRCAEAQANGGNNAEAAEQARRAWIAGITDAAEEAAFLRRWSGAVRPEDQWERFQHLAWQRRGSGGPPDPAPRSGASDDGRGAARAAARCARRRCAARRAYPPRAALRSGHGAGSCPVAAPSDRTADALALWQRAGEAAQRDAPREQLGGVLDRAQPARPPPAARRQCRRRLCARRGPRPGQPRADAGRGVPRGLHRIAPAERSRRRDAPLHHACRPFQVGDHPGPRALLARPRRCRRGQGCPRPEYERAAAWPTTFYGQLAALALGDDAAALARRVSALHDPAYSREQVLAFTDREVVRAAAMLVAWNDPHRARAFLLRMDELAPDPADRALTARLALRPRPARYGGVRRPPHGSRRTGVAGGRLADRRRTA